MQEKKEKRTLRSDLGAEKKEGEVRSLLASAIDEAGKKTVGTRLCLRGKEQS